MRACFQLLALAWLVVVLQGLSAADDKKDDSVKGVPKDFFFDYKAVAQFAEVKSIRHVPKKEFIVSGIVYMDVKKFKGLKVQFWPRDEDNHMCGEGPVKVIPEKEDYLKGDKITIKFSYPNEKSVKLAREAVLIRIKDKK